MHSVLRVVVSILLGVAYITCLLQWLWVAIVGVPPLLKTGAFDSFVQTPPPQPIPPATHIELSPIATALVGVFTLIILVITVVVIIRIPRTITRTGEKIVHQAADTVVPAVTHHKKLPAKKQRQLSERITIVIQLIITVLPIGICFLLPTVGELTTQIIAIVELFLGAISLAGFTLAGIINLKLPPAKHRPHKTATH